MKLISQETRAIPLTSQLTSLLLYYCINQAIKPVTMSISKITNKYILFMNSDLNLRSFYAGDPLKDAQLI